MYQGYGAVDAPGKTSLRSQSERLRRTIVDPGNRFSLAFGYADTYRIRLRGESGMWGEWRGETTVGETAAPLRIIGEERLNACFDYSQEGIPPSPLLKLKKIGMSRRACSVSASVKGTRRSRRWKNNCASLMAS